METKSTPRPHLHEAAIGMTLLLLAQANKHLAKTQAIVAAKR